jgi:hypothetical protein
MGRLTTNTWAGFIVQEVIGGGAQTFWMRPEQFSKTA